MKSSVHASSRIIQNENFGFRLNESSVRGSNYNKVCLNSFLTDVDYKDMSKLSISIYVENCFFDYLENFNSDKNGIIVTDGKNNNIFHYYNKFDSRYKGKIKRRMKYLCHKYRNGDCVFLTLTLDPKLYDSLVDMWLDIKKQQNRFLCNLNKFLCYEKVYHCYLEDGEMKREIAYEKYRDLPKFLSSIECQHGMKSWLNPHIHFVFLGCKRIMDWRRIRDIWKLGFVWINRTNDGKKIRKPIDYLTKYITKTYSETDSSNIQDQSIQWFFNIRSFSYSNGLVYPINYNVQDLDLLFYLYCDSEYIMNWFKMNKDSLLDYFFRYENKGVW